MLPGRFAPDITILPWMFNWALTSPGPQMPRTTALTDMPWILMLWGPPTVTCQGRPAALSAPHAPPLKVAPVIVAPLPTVVALIEAVHGSDTAVVDTVTPPLMANGASLGAVKCQAEAELAAPRAMRPTVAAAMNFFMVGILF